MSSQHDVNAKKTHEKAKTKYLGGMSSQHNVSAKNQSKSPNKILGGHVKSAQR